MLQSRKYKARTRLVGHGVGQAAGGEPEGSDLYRQWRRGGTRIDQHQRNDENPTDLDTIYGRMLWRVRQARLTHGIRAIIWHQGENDQGAAGPDGGYGWETYQRYFVEMSADWKRDFPNVSRYYVFQIWPNACSMGGGNGDMLREKQRTLPRLYSNMDVMSTLGIKPPGPCHLSAERLVAVRHSAAAADRTGLLRQEAHRFHHGPESQAGLLHQRCQGCHRPGIRSARRLEGLAGQ